MIKVRQVKVGITNKTKEDIKRKTAKKLNIKESDIISLFIRKESLDARDKSNIHYSYEVDVVLKNEDNIKLSNDISFTEEEKYVFNISGTKRFTKRPIIVGAGPAGLFSAYVLAENGYNPIVIERGEKVEERVKTVLDFWNSGVLNKNSNVSFGEGGAGTFSDGKLNTLVKDKNNRCFKVFETFVKCGASEEIMYENKPHIGTDLLRNVVVNMRNKIIEMGGEFHYNTILTDIEIENDAIKSIIVNNNKRIECEVLILAIGHSARDTFEMLYNKKINMTSKPFAVGIRIQHPQDMVNISQYGDINKYLPNASYKLTYTASNKRGVYSFCMCPGGYVVNASSEDNRLVINGMSNHKRDSKNANSAIIVTVTKEDFGEGPLAALEYQRDLEEKAYMLGHGKIPVQLWNDFENNKISTSFGDVEPIFKGDYYFANLNDLLPSYIVDSLREAIPYFDTKIKGFARGDAIIAGIESRTSSPIRIERNENLVCNVKGIYPCGEGSGYAGGITTSAMDGIKVAEEIAKIYNA